MPYQLTFSVKQNFRTAASGITIPFSLERSGIAVFSNSKVDNGGEYCLFQRELADELEIEVEDGTPVLLNTLTGSFTAYALTV